MRSTNEALNYWNCLKMSAETESRHIETKKKEKWNSDHWYKFALIIGHLFLLTLHELVSSDNIKLASSQKTQHQRVRFIPELLQHQFSQVVSLCCSLLHHDPQVLQWRHPPLIRLVQLILCLHGGRRNMKITGTNTSNEDKDERVLSYFLHCVTRQFVARPKHRPMILHCQMFHLGPHGLLLLWHHTVRSSLHEDDCVMQL